MDNPNDGELLRRYASAKSEVAFAELVRRYAPLVYSAALRQTGDAEDARDVAQDVFSALARKAERLAQSPVLAGWLYQSVRLQCLELRRNDRRRLQRESQVLTMSPPAIDTAPDWEVIRPVLDDAIAGLSEEDRGALLLRFFKNENLEAVGSALGVSEDAAQKRVSRALLRLREALVLRGITCATDALSASLDANAVEHVPEVLIGLMTSPPQTPVGATAGLHGWNTASVKTVTLALVTALAALTLIHVHTISKVDGLYGELAKQADELARLRAENVRLSALLAEANLHQNQNSEANTLEIARLRAKLAQLRESQISPKIDKVAPTNISDGTSAPPQLVIQATFFTRSSKDSNFRQRISESAEAETAAEMAAATNDPDITLIQMPAMTLRLGTSGHLAAEDTVAYNGGQTNVGLALGVATEANNSTLTKIELMIQATRLNDESNIDIMTVTNELSGKIKSGLTVKLQDSFPNPGSWFAADHADSTAQRELETFITFSLVDSAGNLITPAPNTDPNPSR